MITGANNRHDYSSQPVVIGGFVTILLLLAALFAVWYHSVELNNRVFSVTSHKLNEMQLIYQIRDGANRRAIFLLRMTQTTNDPFLLDEQYIRFKEAASPLLQAREQLLGSNASKVILRMWEKTRGPMNTSTQAQIRAAQFMLDDELDAAQKVVFNEVLPAQNVVFQMLDNMLEAQRETVAKQLIAAADKNRHVDSILLMLATITLVLGVFVSSFVIRRNNKSETQLRQQSDRFRSMYDITAVSGFSLNDQVSEMLRLGCQLTEMEFGSLVKIDSSRAKYEVINAINIDGQSIITKGQDLLCAPLFLDTIKYKEPLAVENYSRPESENYKTPLSPLFKSYIGISLAVHNKPFGTLNFSAPEVRKTAFTDTDKDLITLMGRWVSVVLERIMEQTELDNAKQAAESANHAKSAFIANMSHEIRTPLTSIIGFANSLLDPSRSAIEHDDAAHTIVRSSEHLHELINDILDLSKIEAGQLMIEKMPISPLAVVAEVESVIGYRARSKGLNFVIKAEYPLPKTIVNDPTRLKQILLNLCSNAEKFTREGTITILTQYDAQRRQIIFTVSDTGIGMNEDEINHIFQPFSQADSSTTRRFGGTGLGLWISRQLAQQLGGDITCNSRKGQGSSFEVRLVIGSVDRIKLIHAPPVKLPSLANQTTNSERHAPQLCGRVLLAEDSPDIQKLVNLVLNKTGVDVVTVDDGQMAVDTAMSDNFDLILMDMQMPVMGGMEATQILRDKGYSKPIIALSANALKEDQDKSSLAGFDDYLTKPLLITQFYDMLKIHLLPRKDKAADKKPAQGSLVNEELSSDPEFHALIELFVKTLPKQVAEIVGAADSANWDQVQAVSHKLKGSGAAFGHPVITDIASRINQQMKIDYRNLPNQTLLENISSLQEYCGALLEGETKIRSFN